MPDPNFILAPEITTLQVRLEPALNMFHSLMLLNKAEHLSGLGEWVIQTKAVLTPEEDYQNRLVLFGLFFAVEPDRNFPSFEAYLDHLENLDPIELRDRTFKAYAPLWLDQEKSHPIIRSDYSMDELDIDFLLGDVNAFLDFLRQRFSASSIDVKLESEAHRYLNDPPEMQKMIVSHLRFMWERFLEPEWQKTKHIIQASVDAFQKVDFATLTKVEAISMVTGQEFNDCMKYSPDNYDQIVFIPSVHVGPYTGKIEIQKTLYILFGARVPEGVDANVPDLSRSEILVRVNALADDNRLRILRLISDEGEMRSQEIMSTLDLSQSASSRHLKQLSATGFLLERRCNGAKCYNLNAQKIEDTLKAISKFLLGS